MMDYYTVSYKDKKGSEHRISGFNDKDDAEAFADRIKASRSYKDIQIQQMM